jgi:hypothetical protein
MLSNKITGHVIQKSQYDAHITQYILMRYNNKTYNMSKDNTIANKSEKSSRTIYMNLHTYKSETLRSNICFWFNATFCFVGYDNNI